MSDFSTGAIVDDDLDLSAAKGRSKSHEAVAAKTAAWGGKGLNAAIGVSAVIMVAGIVLWGVQLSGGMVQTGMRNLSSWGLYITSFMFFVGLSPAASSSRRCPRPLASRASAASPRWPS